MAKPGRRHTKDLAAENERLKAKLSQIRKYGAFSGVTKVSGEALRSLRVILPFYFIYKAFEAYAGKVSFAKIDADVRTSIDVESQTLVDMVQTFASDRLFCVLALLIGLFGVGYGRVQSKLRKDDVQHLEGPKIAYEKSRDPRRSSSSLTTRGETRPEDE